MTAPNSGWHADPSSPQQVRYWDGQKWTDHTAPIPPQQQPPQSKRGMSGGAKALVVVGIVLAVGLVGCGALVALVGSAADEADEAIEEEQAREAEDVEISECTSDAAGMVAKLTVTNNSSKRSTYSVDVTFESPDGTTQFATGLTFVDAVEPGQTATSDAHSLVQAPGEFTCRVVTVDRMADPGGVG